MLDSNRRKQLLTEYREREIIGGVYLVKNTLKNKALLDASTDLQGSKNRFEFAQQTGAGVFPKLQEDWNTQPSSSFEFEILEQIQKNDGQTAAEFQADVNLLAEIWSEKLADEDLY